MRLDQDEAPAPASGNGNAEGTASRLDTGRITPTQAPSSRIGNGIMIAVTLVALLAIVGLAAYHGWRTKTASTSRSSGGRAGVPVPVVAGVVSTKDVPIFLDGLGTVQAFNTVTVHTRVDGQVLKVAFKEGQDVKVGDVLAQLDPAQYQAALDQAVAKKAQDQAQWANARVDLQRYADLLKTDSTTQQTFDTQRALVDQLAASIQADQAAVDSAKVNLDYTTIRSPIDGRTGIRLVDLGNIVRASDTGGLVVLTQLRPISLLFTLPEQSLSKLQRQPDGAFPVLAMAREDTNVLAQGQVSVIDNQIDTATGTIKIKATFANDQLRLWPGQFVNARLLLTVRTNGIVVPASVVQRGPEGPFAFVINEDDTVEMRPIQVAQIDQGEALIEGGLKPGERIVVDGQYKLQAGSTVRNLEPAADSSAAAPKTERTRKPQ